MQHLGETAAIATAICWTGSSLFFALATRRVGGIAVNQFRLWLALPCLLLLHELVLGAWFPELTSRRYLLLAASGLVGLVLGDIGYFYSLGVLGPRVSSVLMATWPAMALLLEWAIDQRGPSWRTALGVAMTMLGVMVVVMRQREGSVWLAGGPRGNVVLAVLGALGGALGQAIGSVLVAIATRADVAVGEAGVPGLSAALVRMAAASVGIAVVALLQRRLLACRAVLADAAALRFAVFGTSCGPVAGVWLSMVALANGDVGIVASLTATTPVFMMPVARIAYGARIGLLGVVGTLLAVSGVVVMRSG